MECTSSNCTLGNFTIGNSTIVNSVFNVNSSSLSEPFGATSIASHSFIDYHFIFILIATAAFVSSILIPVSGLEKK